MQNQQKGKQEADKLDFGDLKLTKKFNSELSPNGIDGEIHNYFSLK